MVTDVLGRSSEVTLALFAVGVLVVAGGAAVADTALDVVSAAAESALAVLWRAAPPSVIEISLSAQMTSRSPFYDNLLEGWATDSSFPLLYSRSAVEANQALRFVLEPAD